MVYAAFIWLLVQVLLFVSWLLPLAASIFTYIIDSNNILIILKLKAIHDAWVIVRDALNIAFIFVLVFTAFCTIFQIEKYNYKKILLTLVLMALLVNFSLPITRFVIDVSNSLMYTLAQDLLPNNANNAKYKVDAFGIITADSALDRFFLPNEKDLLKQDASLLIAAIVFVFVFAATLLSVAVLLVVRIIALAILIIFSPIGFVGMIFPGTNSFASKFWDNLFRYCFFGPVMIFVIYIATQLMVGLTKAGVLGTINKIVVGQTATSASTIAAMALYFIPVTILWLGMGIAQQMSIAGASAVTGKAQGFLGWAAKNLTGYRAAKWGIKTGGKAAAQKFEESVLAKRGLSPTAIMAGWKARRDAARKDIMDVESGKWRDRWNRFMTIKNWDGKNGTNYGDIAQQGVIARKQKEMADTSQQSAYLMQNYLAAKGTGDFNKMAGILRIMYNNNDQNEFMKLQGKTYSPRKLTDEIEKDLKEAGMDKSQIIKQLTDFSEIGFAKGHFADYGATTFSNKRVNEDTGELELIGDGKTSEWRRATAQEQQEAAVGKAKNMDVQNVMKINHHNNFLEEIGAPLEGNAPVKIKVFDPQSGEYKGEQEMPHGGLGNLHDEGKAFLNEWTNGHNKQVNRTRPDFVANLYERIGDIVNYANNLEKGTETIKDANGNPLSKEKTDAQVLVIRGLVDKIREEKVAVDKNKEAAAKGKDKETTTKETIEKETIEKEKVIERDSKLGATMSGIDDGLKNLGSNLINIHSVLEELLKVSKKKAANDLDEDEQRERDIEENKYTRI